MKKLLSKTYRKHHLWLGSLVVFFVLFLLLRQSRAAMNFLAFSVILPLMQWVGRLCGALPFSVAEALIFCAVWVVLWYGIHQLRRRRYARLLVTLAEVTVTVLAAAALLWGSFYHCDSFQDKSGLTARGGTAEELTAVTAHFAQGVAAHAECVARDDRGVFAVPRREIIAYAPHSYEGVAALFPCLSPEVLAPKSLAFSRLLSAMDFTGFYFAFTGEANVNVDSPACYLPTTVCHELAHQQGIASEQECNFIGIMAAITCDDPAYNYAGYLNGYVHLANALYRVDKDAWQAIRDTIPEAALIDLEYHRDYWAQFEGPVSTVSTTLYDGYLKANGLEGGIANYGTVVDLLLAQFGYLMNNE